MFHSTGLSWLLSGQETICHCRRGGFNPWVGKEMAIHSYSCLGNSKDRGAWWATVKGVTKEGLLKSWTQLRAKQPQSQYCLIGDWLNPKGLSPGGLTVKLRACSRQQEGWCP